MDCFQVANLVCDVISIELLIDDLALMLWSSSKKAICGVRRTSLVRTVLQSKVKKLRGVGVSSISFFVYHVLVKAW